MTNLKDQIQQGISKGRAQSENSGPAKRDDAENRLDEIRQGLDELPHKTDDYELKVEYAVGPYATDIAIAELYDSKGAWVARWEIAPTVGGSVAEWEVTYNPRGVETQHKWFRDADGLFDYLTASIAERVVEMETDSR